jgi:hypothetical protein
LSAKRRGNRNPRRGSNTALTPFSSKHSRKNVFAKQAILAFVKEVTDNKSNPKYVAPEDRIAAFDQDGTLWVQHPMYTQVIYRLERVPF